MRTIDIGLKSIDKIFHIADVHVRNVKRHAEYEQVFKRWYKYIKKHIPTVFIINQSIKIFKIEKFINYNTCIIFY